MVKHSARWEVSTRRSLTWYEDISSSSIVAIERARNNIGSRWNECCALLSAEKITPHCRYGRAEPNLSEPLDQSL